MVLAGALALRVYGLRWGLPGRADMNPDEETVLAIVGRISWRNLDPGAYFYGGFFYQACVVVRSILQALWPGIGEPALVLAYRSVSATFGGATVAVLYLLLRRLAPSGPAPLIGATLLAIMPLHVWDSHFAVTDITLTFWTTATVTAAVSGVPEPEPGAVPGRLRAGRRGHRDEVQRRHGDGRDRAGGPRGHAGTTASCPGSSWPGASSGLAVALLALFVASPHMFLQWEANWRAFQREMRRVWIPNYGFSVWAPGWQYKPYLYQLAVAFPFSFGVALYEIAGRPRVLRGPMALGLHDPARVRGVLPRRHGALGLVPIRYYLPFEPVLLLAPALALAAGLTAPSARARRWTAIALVGVVGYTLAFTVSTTARFADDTRLQARRWLQPVRERGREHPHGGGALVFAGSEGCSA